MATQTADKTYCGFYCRLLPDCDEKHVGIHGDRVAVGQEVSFIFENYVNSRDKDSQRILVLNLANEPIGFIPQKEAKRLVQLNAQGWICRVAISAVGFKDADRTYFAEAAIICYELNAAHAFNPFAEHCFKQLANGSRLELNLSDKLVRRIERGEDIFDSIKLTRYPKLPKGEVWYKTKRSITEKMIISASQRKVGCFIGAGATALIAAAVCVFCVVKLLGII